LRRCPVAPSAFFSSMRAFWSLHAQRPCSQWQRSCGLEVTHIDINSAPKCSICSFQRTSQIEFTLRETVDEGQGVVDHVGSEPHVCDGVATAVESGDVGLGYWWGLCCVIESGRRAIDCWRPSGSFKFPAPRVRDITASCTNSPTPITATSAYKAFLVLL
jgi:hypothetical protein